MNLRVAKRAIAISAVLASINAFAQVALPAPTPGTLNIWYKAPLAGATVSGTLSNDKCYVKGIGVTRVDFYLDATLLNADTNVADGMSCVLDTTKFANGTHQLKATARNAAGATYNEVVSINIQNAGSTTPPPANTPPPATTPASPIANVDILNLARADIPFAQQQDYRCGWTGCRLPITPDLSGFTRPGSRTISSPASTTGATPSR